MFLLWLLVGLVTLNWAEDINGFWLQSTVAVTEYEWHYKQQIITVQLYYKKIGIIMIFLFLEEVSCATTAAFIWSKL